MTRKVVNRGPGEVDVTASRLREGRLEGDVHVTPTCVARPAAAGRYRALRGCIKAGPSSKPAIYGLLEGRRPTPVREDAVREDGAVYDAACNVANRDLASLIDEEVAPFTELVDWWQKDDLQRQMRSRIKRRLRAGGVAADIVDLARVRTGR